MASSPRSLLRESATLLLTVSLLLIARSSLADHYTVPSGSMRPSVHVGDHVLVNKSAYGLRVPLTMVRITPAEMPRRGDVIVLESPEEDMVLLKRVVAVAGDEVSVRAGRLTLNGEAVPVDPRQGLEFLGKSPHAVSLSPGGPAFGPARVPEGKLLVMGDNRGNSHDGRAFGFVSASAVLGRAVAVVFRDGTLAWIDL